MKTARHWANQICREVQTGGTPEESMRFLTSMVEMIQSDALQADGPSDAELLYTYHSQQKEWWRTNTDDPHNIGTALYTMHCELVDIYDAILSGDAKRNYEANSKLAQSPNDL